MADSASVISKNSEKSKLTNLINRTTTETLRLNDIEKAVNSPNSLSTNAPRKKTSFQITSVIVARPSNDGGDDSADDLDESHAEDISEVLDNSRITDLENETPSYSEDTFSKDDVFFNASSSLVSAPVIPTSSQYGLAIVATPENSESALNPEDNCVNSDSVDGSGVDSSDVTSAGVINLGVVSTKHDPEMRDMHPPAPRTERFKVVKIESTEPFKRGRWVCMDYFDHNIAQKDQNTVKSDSTENSGSVITESNSIAATDQSPVVNSTAEEQILTTVPSEANSNSAANMQPNESNQVSSNQVPISSAPTAVPTSYPSVSPGQSLQNNMQMGHIINSAAPPPQASQQSQSLSQVHMQQILANSNQHQSLQPQQIQQVLASANVMPIQQQQQPQQQQQQQQQQPPPQQPPQQQQQQNPIQQQTMQQQPVMQQQPMQQMQQMHQPQQFQPQQQTMPQQQQQQPMHQQTMPQQQPLPQQQTMPQPQAIPQQQPQQTMAQQPQQTMSQQPQQQPIQQQPQVMPQQQTMPQQQSIPQQQPQQISQPQQNIPQQQQSMSQQQGMPQQQQGMPQQQQGMPQQQQSMPQQQQSIPQQSLPQQQFQPMQQQQQQPIMQQQMPQQMQPQMSVQQVQMQPNVQQIPMQQPQNQPMQQQPMMQQPMQQMQQPTQMHQASYPQPMQQAPQPIMTQNTSQQQVPGMMQQMHPQQMQGFQQGQMMPNIQSQPIMNIQSQPHIQPQYYSTSQPLPAGIVTSQPGMMTQGSLPQVSMPGTTPNLPPLQTYAAVASLPPMGQVPNMPQTPPIPTSVQYTMPHMAQAGQQMTMPPMTMPQTIIPTQQQPPPQQQQPQPAQSYAGISSPAQSYTHGMSSSSVPSAVVMEHMLMNGEHGENPTAALIESLNEVTASGDDVQPGDDAESTSGANAVAIDNKIEQAMDLVKSHLMYAVREEVEVLKEKIAELMERISQLEAENATLRAGASPETLALLPPPSQTSTTNNP